jgi:hypothetical protein
MGRPRLLLARIDVAKPRRGTSCPTPEKRSGLFPFRNLSSDAVSGASSEVADRNRSGNANLPMVRAVNRN